MRVSVSLVLGVGLGCSSPALWAETESPAELEVLTVTAEAERAEGPVQGYRANRSASATRTDTRIEDIPQAISVVPRQVLDDLDSARIERALDFAGGVSRQNNFGGLTMFEYNVRGFTTSEFYRDGFSANRGYMNAPDSATIERVEILKGPASSLYGRGDPGGTVNLVTKKPQAERFARLHASAGSWDRYRSTLDLNTPLDEEGDLLYRMNLAVEDSKGFRDYADGQRLLVAPSFSWQLDPDTSLLVEAEVVRNRQVFDRGTVAPHNHLGSLPRSRFFGEPDDGKIDNNNETLQATLRHHFNEQWSLRLASHYKHGHLDGYASENSSLAADGYSLRREYRYRDFEWHDSITQLDLLGDLHTGSIRHQLLMGLEYERYHNDELILRSIPSRNPYAIDIRRPVYGQPKPPFGRDDRNHEEVRRDGAQPAGPDRVQREMARPARRALRPLPPGHERHAPEQWPLPRHQLAADPACRHPAHRRAVPGDPGGRPVRQRLEILQAQWRYRHGRQGLRPGGGARLRGGGEA